MTTARVSGLDQLKAKFRALPDELRKEIGDAMEKGAEEIVKMARRLVPKDTGELANSIGWTWGEPPAGSITIAQSKPRPGDDQRITIYAGNDKAIHARWLEFGTVKMRAQPYFYPSYRALRRRVTGRVNRALRKAAKTVAGNGN